VPAVTCGGLPCASGGEEGWCRPRLPVYGPGMDDRLLTAHEVADQLRVSTMTIYRLIRRGELPAVRVGRNYRVRAGELDAYLQAQVVDPSTVDLDELEQG
jgi:excisionase family DNA binding protein